MSHYTTATRADIESHSLGILPDPADDAMATLERYGKQVLIQRHHAHMRRLHEGIRQRAVEHAAEVAVFAATTVKLKATVAAQGRRINNLMLGIAFLAGLALYFAVRARC